jgi:hypothetical protein
MAHRLTQTATNASCHESLVDSFYEPIAGTHCRCTHDKPLRAA